ncbi:hypothetical protein GBAR_LOCUS28113 [Geodia barretti]|uniref:Uncharacterized protein n=1 Tax=Geodia barretti TaxID=519541 RepID=A0AA35TPC7_GEOBA|nr:hypothetical protein GBAR_LOCUS28113 [Geodia barretti]
MADRPAGRKARGGNKKKRRKAARGEANRGRSQPVPPQPSPSPLPTLVRAPRPGAPTVSGQTHSTSQSDSPGGALSGV